MTNMRRKIAAAWLVLAAGLPVSAWADALRPQVARPLQQAEHDLAKDALPAARKQLALADEVPDKTPAETLTIAELRAAIDAAAKNYAAAAADDAALLSSNALPPAQAKLTAQAEASYSYLAGNYAMTIAAIHRYLPDDPQFSALLLQAYLKTGACDALDAAVEKMPDATQGDLQMVAYCYGAAKNQDGYMHALSLLVAKAPSPQAWSQLLALEQQRPEFGDVLALDFFRLKLAAGVTAAEPDYMDMAQAALQASQPNEAAAILAAGTAAGVLGGGADLDRQGRLKTMVAQRQAAAAHAAAPAVQLDAPGAFAAGFNQVEGGNPAGLALMAGAIRSGQLPDAGRAELELGIAYFVAGQDANARAMWHAVQGGGAPAALASLWLDLRQAPPAPG